MAEVLVEFTDVVLNTGDRRYLPRACGAEAENGTWFGWIEFVDVNTGDVLRTSRETTQPNRPDTLYWATGLTPVYLEGALERALHPLTKPPSPRPAAAPPPFPQPAPDFVVGDSEAGSVLNPFAAIRKGETVLRRQLGALSTWHLVNIIRDYELSDLSASALNALTGPDLVEIIVAGVKRRGEAVSR